MVFWVANAAVNRYYMSADAVAERKAGIYTELNRFVTAGNVAGNDAEALQRFLDDRAFVSVTVYSPEELGLPDETQPVEVFREAGAAGRSLYVAVRKPAGQSLALSGHDERNGKFARFAFKTAQQFFDCLYILRTIIHEKQMLNLRKYGRNTLAQTPNIRLNRTMPKEICILTTPLVATKQQPLIKNRQHNDTAAVNFSIF